MFFRRSPVMSKRMWEQTQAGCGLEDVGYAAGMFRIACLILCGAAVAGCKSGSWGPYVAPCVEGRVLDAETGGPLAGARVSRTRPPEGGSQPLKGAELLMRKPDIQTRSEERRVGK